MKEEEKQERFVLKKKHVNQDYVKSRFDCSEEEKTFRFFATSGAPYLGHRIDSAETEITFGAQFFVLYNFGLGSF